VIVGILVGGLRSRTCDLGLAYDDATGYLLGWVSPEHGRTYRFLLIDERRQMAVQQTSSRNEGAVSLGDDKLAQLETSRPPQGAPETLRLPRAAQLPKGHGLAFG
jgi:hypothetical protein